MAIMIKNNFKNTIPIYKRTWYSILKHNKKSTDFTIGKMVNRFKKSDLIDKTNMLIFYDNITKVEIERVKF